MQTYNPRNTQPKAQNTYKNQEPESSWSKPFKKLKTATKLAGATLGLTALLLTTNYIHQRGLKPSGVEIVDGPKGYEFYEHSIPTKGNIDQIVLGNDTIKMEPVPCPETNTITYTGPIEYRISNPRSPVPDPEVIRDLERDTRYGSVVLRKTK